MINLNNTAVTITIVKVCDSWCSAGTAGFKGSRKSTPFAARKRLITLQGSYGARAQGSGMLC